MIGKTKRRTGGAPGRPAADRASRPLTAERLRNIAEHYVGQRESSAAMLREVLERRLRRHLRTLDPDAAAEDEARVRPLIEAEIRRLEEAGLVQDARYAEMKARAGFARGRGMRRILRDLGQKGVEGDTAKGAVLDAAREFIDAPSEAEEPGEVLRAAETEAADTFARKKRFGPYRSGALPEDSAGRAKVWRREAGAMARAGFGVDTIRRVLDQPPEEG
jgi:regulatory protein